MAGPSMIKSGYDVKMSAGAITAGGTLGILIPPSVMLIVMGPVVGVPATDLFAAAVLPGLLLSAIFIAWTLLRCWHNPSAGPGAAHGDAAQVAGPGDASTWLIGVLPVIVVILSTLGVILAGIATPTDAGAVGCGGHLRAHRRLRPHDAGQDPHAPGVDARDLEHDPAAGDGLEPVRLGVLAPGQRRLPGADADQPVAAADADADRHPGAGVRARLAAGMGADRADRGADRAADRAGRRHRPDLVLHAGGGDAADGLAVAAGGAVGLLPEGRGAAVGDEGHLRRHGAVHDPAAGGGGAAADLPEAGHLAASAELRHPGPSATIGATMHTTPRIPGQRFLHSPGPTRLPDEVLHAMGRQPMDLADPRLDPIIAACEAGLKRLLHTDRSDVLMYAANGHGAWEAVIVNLLGPGRAALIPGTGHFSESWAIQTEALGCKVVRTPWVEGLPIDVAAVEQALRDDTQREIVAVFAVHTDTASGVTSDLHSLRLAIDASGHPALFVVDVVASLGVVPFDMDALRADVVIGASQKGLMLPPGLGFVAINERARVSAEANPTPRFYWDWGRRRDALSYRKFCGTPPMNLLFGLQASLQLIFAEGLDAVFARHRLLAGAVHAAVQGWSEGGALGFFCQEPARRSHSQSRGAADGGEGPVGGGSRVRRGTVFEEGEPACPGQGRG